VTIHFAHTIELVAAPSRVFAVLEDVGQTPRWLARCTGIETLSPGPLARGTRLRYAYRVGGRSGTMDGEVTAREADRHLAMHYVDKVMAVTVDFRTTAKGSGTSLIHTIDIVPRSFIVKLFAGMIRKAIPGQTIRAMETLRDLVDGGPVTMPSS
jgi:uncharacterized protein YndB with AHSA1/START domain